jgi:RND family efflux transporter MFP subunit
VGSSLARQAVDIVALSSGRIAEIAFTPGQRVERGTVLVRLDDVAERADVAEAEAMRREAELALDRARKLRTNNTVAQATVDELEAAYAGTSARLDGVKKELADRTVRAPFAGVVTVKAAQPGEMISPISAGGGSIRTGIGTVVDMDSLEIQVDVSESYINRVQPGQKVEAVLNAYPDWRIPASVIAIVPTADRSKATVKVRIALGEKDERIVPEMGVRVAFLESGTAGAVQASAPRGTLVPAAALRQDAGKDVLFLLRDGRAERRAVTLGGSLGDSRQVLAGVTAGDPVIVDAPEGLKDGDAVAAREAADE